jgi:hypothetical protein
LQAEGNSQAATAAKERALEALEAAMKIQAIVIDQSKATIPNAKP